MNNKEALRNIYLKIKPLKFIWRKMNLWYTRFFLRFNPKVIANRAYKSRFKKNINWDKPLDLIEKIYWLQIYSDTSLWTKCADKYLVRDYVKEKNCSDVLNELYYKWDNVNDIDWNILPDEFVLKANHSCGQVMLVKNKNKLDINHTELKLKNWMKSVYGYTAAELHYSRIKPIIIAEKLFDNKKDPDKSLIDYKIWCFQGNPECILVSYDRTDGNYSLSMYDLEWNNISETAFNKKGMHYRGEDIEKPLSFDRMIEVAKILSKDLPQVRVDFYDIDGKAVFGEMTFSTGYGSYSEKFYKHLGSKIELSKVEKLPKPNYIPLLKK